MSDRVGWIALLVVAAGCVFGADTPGKSVTVDGLPYYLVTCSAKLDHGSWHRVGRFDDGLVVTPHRDGHGFDIDPGRAPDALCRWLPHGCACTTTACTWPARRARGEGGPRCDADDPTCLPVAFDHGCVMPSRERIAVALDDDGGAVTTDSNCAFDGECVDSGCGYRCESTRERGGEHTCEGREDLDRKLATAQCGCVRGRCRWFEPRP